MASIQKYADRKCSETTDLILESDSEILTLPVIEPNISKPAIGSCDCFCAGSTAFCPLTQNAWVLTRSGWIKIT